LALNPQTVIASIVGMRLQFYPMKPRAILWVALALLFSPGITPCLEAAGPKPVMVYYMPWYMAKPYSGSWGWHWTMNHFDPEKLNASGERIIASWYYPLIGPYDSSDPAVLEYHVLLMKLGGVDGVIVDWYGSANYLDYAANNQATARLFNYIRKAGLKFAVCFEDQTIQRLIDGRQLTAAAAIQRAQQEILYLQTNFFFDPAYLRLDGKPLFLNFGPQYFRLNSQWEEILSVLVGTNRPAFFTEDNRLEIGLGAFNWPPMWMSQLPGTGGVLSGVALNNYLAGFEQKARGWPAFISSAFPRFHDIYQRAGNRNYWGYLGDRNGETFRETLRRAMTNSSVLVQIVTWNDFGEGTAVEPTREYGFRDLGIIQDFRRQYLDPGFSLHTNDLHLALQFYQLRRQSGTNTALAAGLDQAFATIVSGRLNEARRELDKLQSSLPEKMER
jgi:hypothetical protein